MVANIVFSISLFVCLLLVKLQAKPHTIHVSGVSSTVQTLPVPGSWILRPQNLPLTGSLTFGNKKYPLGRLPGRVVASAKSDGDSKTELNSTTGGTSKNRLDNMKSVTTDDKTSSNFKIMTSVWELKHGAPTLSLIDDDYKKLASQSCYIIFQTPIVSEEEFRLEIYYWIGSQSSDEDATTAANVAMLNRYVYNKDISIKLHREVEGQESNAFRKLFKSFKTERKSDAEASEPNDTDGGRIFMLGGKNTSEDRQEKVLELSEVELPLAEVLRDERSCFVFVLERVYISCGVNANIRYKFGAEELAKIMMNRKGLKDEEVEMYRTDILFSGTKPEGKVLAQFFKKFEHLSGRIVKQRIDDTSEEFTRKELRRILDQTAMSLNGKECWFNMKVTRIFENTSGGDLVQEENVFLPDPLIPLLLENHSKDCLLVDSRSNVGIFVWMGKEATTEVSAECARRAELYLRKKDYNFANRITFVHQEDLPLEVDTAQIIVEFLAANDEDSQDQLSELSSTAEDSSQEFDNSVADDDALPRSGDDVSSQNDVSSSKKSPSSRNRRKKKRNHEEAVKRLKVLLQPARSEITNQYNLRKDGLTFDQLAELLEYSKQHSGGELCKMVNIQPAEIEAVLTQLETLHSKVRNRGIRRRLTTLSSKLKQQKLSPPSDGEQ